MNNITVNTRSFTGILIALIAAIAILTVVECIRIGVDSNASCRQHADLMVLAMQAGRFAECDSAGKEIIMKAFKIVDENK